MPVQLRDCKKGDTIFFALPGDKRRIGKILAVSPTKNKVHVSYRIVQDRLGSPLIRETTSWVHPDHVEGFA